MTTTTTTTLPPPTVTPAIREPHWQALAHDLNWRGLWSTGAVADEVARLEARLHNTKHTDHLDMIDVKARLDAYRWLRETVAALADKASEREIAAIAAAMTPTSAQSPRSRWRRAVDTVLPPVIG